MKLIKKHIVKDGVDTLFYSSSILNYHNTYVFQFRDKKVYIHYFCYGQYVQTENNEDKINNQTEFIKFIDNYLKKYNLYNFIKED
jgi:hypothetical protein